MEMWFQLPFKQLHNESVQTRLYIIKIKIKLSHLFNSLNVILKYDPKEYFNLLDIDYVYWQANPLHCS